MLKIQFSSLFHLYWIWSFPRHVIRRWKLFKVCNPVIFFRNYGNKRMGLLIFCFQDHPYFSKPQLTYSCIYEAFFAMVLLISQQFWKGWPAADSRFLNHNPGFNDFPFIGKSLSHLRFKINLSQKLFESRE